MRAIMAMICFCFLLFGFSSNENFKKKEKTPLGTVRLNDSLFIDKTEVANVHWREFTQGWLLLIKHDTTLYEEMLTDTSVWSSFSNGKYSSFAGFYYEHPSYNNFPVVGITYEKAVAFCQWRSDRVNERYEREPWANPFPGKKYRYRMPTEAEWEMVASGKMDVLKFPFGFEFMVDKKGRKLANTKMDTVIYEGEHGMKERLFITLPITAYLKNGYGCYNMIGNVSEMVAEKGIAKGGNFLLPLDSCKIKLEQHYTKPEAWLGFRCVCEIVN